MLIDCTDPKDWYSTDYTIVHRKSDLKFWIDGSFHFYRCPQKIIKMTLREKFYLKNILMVKMRERTQIDLIGAIF